MLVVARAATRVGLFRAYFFFIGKDFYERDLITVVFGFEEGLRLLVAVLFVLERPKFDICLYLGVEVSGEVGML